MFGRAWVAVAPQFELSGPKRYLTFDGAGLAVLLVKDAGQTVRAFVNSCRHRGTRLADGSGRCGQVRCPYHGWSWNLDGSVKHIPGAEGFGTLNPERLGLEPLRTESAWGFHWVSADPGAPPLREYLGALDAHVSPYRLQEFVPLRNDTIELPCNWKAMYDNVFELYHLGSVHRRSIGPLVAGGRQDVEYVGDHMTMVARIADHPLRRWLDRRTTRGGPYPAAEDGRLRRTFVFPNFLINTLPSSATVYSVWPDGPTRCRLRRIFMKRRGARGLEWLRAHATRLASQWIFAEDRPIMAAFQQGANAAPQRRHLLHESEGTLAHFHGGIDRWVAGR